ncbi:MAG: SCO1664 family protein [Acidimicrobiales bacterium]
MLSGGTLVPAGRMPWSSNATFLVNVEHDDGTAMPAIYKPVRGERPLWDFPGHLAAREVAAYRLSAILGWGVVPETVMRDDGPFGPGSVQRFVAADFEQHYFTLVETPAHHDGLRTIGAFDLLANNADRKSGHCLLDDDGRIWGIDNGLCFHAHPKLRTVIWDFAGQPIPRPLLADIERVATGGGLADVGALLLPVEAEALARRAAALVTFGAFPDPGQSARAYPWPLV